VNDSIAETVEILGRTLPKMISITTELTDNLPLIQADPAQFEQVLINLGTNARDAMQEGGTIAFTTEAVTVDHDFSSLHPEVGKGRYVCIRVRDTGVGISGELQKHIFEPFYTTKEVGKGTGLGLSTAYGIVKNHEGHIFCESSLGAGTTFTILLPEAKTQPAPAAEEDESHLPHHEKKAAKGTILVVDDDEDIREVAFISLSRLGYRVLTADSGEAALEVYAQHADLVHAVLLDLGMPGMGGEKCLKEILKINREALVVVASGYGLAAKVDDLLALGAKAFVTKPYRFAELDLALTSLAGR
jgi:CheY-like chemotaxis protein